MEIHGVFFDSRLSRRHPAILRAMPRQDGRLNGGLGWLVVYEVKAVSLEAKPSIKPLAEAKASSVNISSRVGNTPRFLRFPDGGVFETGDNDAVDQLTSIFHRYVRLTRCFAYAIIGLVATVFFTWAAIQYGIPFCASVAALLRGF